MVSAYLAITMNLVLRSASVLAFAFAALAAHAVTYDFESVAVGTSVPFAYTVSGLTANFSGGANFQVSSTTVVLPTGFSGKYLVDFSNYSGNLNVGFSSPLSSLSTAFATNGATTLSLSAFLGNALVGTSTAASAGAGSTIGFSGASFDRVVFSNPDRIQLAIDNLVVNPTPEPSALAALGLGALAFVKRRKRA